MSSSAYIATPTTEAAVTDSSTQKKLILVVEDNEHLQKDLRRLLEAYGYSVHTAGNYVDGRGMLEANKYALIMSDNSMPKYSGGPDHPNAGVELLTYASQTDLQRGVPLLMYSGDDSDVLERKLKPIGAHCVRKPSSALVPTIQRLLKAAPR